MLYIIDNSRNKFRFKISASTLKGVYVLWDLLKINMSLNLWGIMRDHDTTRKRLGKSDHGARSW